MKNGRTDHDDEEPSDPKIARIEDARRRRQLGLGGTGARDSKGSSLRPRGSIGQWLTGVLIMAMAAGMLIHWTKPLWQSAVTMGK